jgi:formylglycine-generating enzyme required for sulfatase activity
MRYRAIRKPGIPGQTPELIRTNSRELNYVFSEPCGGRPETSTIKGYVIGLLAALTAIMMAAPLRANLSQANPDLSNVPAQNSHSGNPSNIVLAQSDQPNGGSTSLQRVIRDCADCPEMVPIPAGKFLMGSSDGDNDEKPPHEVHLDKPIAVGKYETTFDEWDACAADGGCQKNKQPKDEGWGRGKHPVIYVSWIDAKEYTEWLSRKTGKFYRLLSEAEWEYAARAGSTDKYAFGDTLDAKQAKFSAGKQGVGETVEVGSFPANAWGLHDMHGNVWEWVEDCYLQDYVGAPTDGSPRSGPGCGSSRVLRGGSWDYNPEDLRSAVRYRLPPYYRVDEIGFRVAREL